MRRGRELNPGDWALHPPDRGNPWAEDPPWIDADWFVGAEAQGELR